MTTFHHVRQQRQYAALDTIYFCTNGHTNALRDMIEVTTLDTMVGLKMVAPYSSYTARYLLHY